MAVTEAGWMSPADLAQRWGVSEDSARRVLDDGDRPSNGKIPAIRIGRLLRVHHDEVVKFEGRGKSRPDPEPKRQSAGGWRKAARQIPNHLGD